MDSELGLGGLELGGAPQGRLGLGQTVELLGHQAEVVLHARAERHARRRGAQGGGRSLQVAELRHQQAVGVAQLTLAGGALDGRLEQLARLVSGPASGQQDREVEDGGQEVSVEEQSAPVGRDRAGRVPAVGQVDRPVQGGRRGVRAGVEGLHQLGARTCVRLVADRLEARARSPGQRAGRGDAHAACGVREQRLQALDQELGGQVLELVERGGADQQLGVLDRHQLDLSGGGIGRQLFERRDPPQDRLVRVVGDARQR